MNNLIQGLRESFSLQGGFSAVVESHHLLLSNRQKCNEILKKSKRDKNDYIDFFIALHMVLEAGINGFFRQIVMIRVQKGVEKTKIAGDLDKVSFIDKVIFFFTLPSFDFQGQIDEADKHYKAIGTLRDFASIRNKLLHGHMVGEFYDSVERSPTRTSSSELLNEEYLQKQIEKFKLITNALSFYFDCWESSINDHGKKEIKKQFLDTSFLEV